MSERLLQRSLPPAPGFGEPLLYARIHGTATLTDDGVALDGGTVTFDTSFGAFSAGRWRRLTTIADLGVRVVGSGSAIVEVLGVSRGREEIVASGAIGERLALPDQRRSAHGSYYLRVTGSGTVGRAEWTTTDAPRRDVRLALSITTFNREPYLRRTLGRIRDLVASEPRMAAHLSVLVVDNAASLDLSDHPEVRVVRSANLGGAGGFARGLIELRRGGEATHVLFMDDDIDLEPESLVRTVALLASATDPDLCVHGAMLSEERPWMQFESGSEYKFRSVYPLQAIGREDDLRDRELALADQPEVPFDYTAWWYTAFPISLATANPLPVFVRGDDVAFGLLHTGRHSVALNGVVVWHADFGLKNNPSSLYYESRNMALIDTLVFDRHRWWHLAYRFASLGFRNLFSMRYASTEYMLRGLNDFLAGPEAWMQIDHPALHDDLRRCAEEKPAPLPPELAALPARRPRPKALRLVGFVVAALCLGGYPLPARLRRTTPGVAPIDARAVGLATFREAIVYRHDRLSEGYIVRRDRARFVRLSREVFGAVVRIARTYRGLKKRYREAYPAMVSDEAWERRFSAAMTQPAGPATSAG